MYSGPSCSGEFGMSHSIMKLIKIVKVIQLGSSVTWVLESFHNLGGTITYQDTFV